MSAPTGWCSRDLGRQRRAARLRADHGAADPDRAGTFGFACGMNMVHGTLLVDPADRRRRTARTGGDGHQPRPRPTVTRTGPRPRPRPPQAEERRAEIADLTRRVVVGAVLTAPVLFAVMAHEVFGADWVPSLLLNHWLQLALITPVMFYTGWPIHRIGWLALAHRAAEMNSLITLGTTRRVRLQPAGHRRARGCCRPTSATCTSRPSASSSR